MVKRKYTLPASQRAVQLCIVETKLVGMNRRPHESFAHSANSLGVRHSLPEHLETVARLTALFAGRFGAGEHGYWSGLWHDLGKFNPEFGRYLDDCEKKTALRKHGPEHKAAGAKLALEYLGVSALAVHGHHGGLVSADEFHHWMAARANSPDVLRSIEIARDELPALTPRARLAAPYFAEKDPLSAEFFVRMLFSALIDADFLDTERHFNAKRGVLRENRHAISSLWERFDRDQSRVTGRQTDAVSSARHEIYKLCLKAAELAPGCFRLTVPTGGGKTRSSMGFALKHALIHGLERVVVAVPYISITEQTAGVYRSIFGDWAVLEHHSAAQPTDDSCDSLWGRLTSENWDSPIIVTTSAQLFESLFSSKPMAARKIHRLARSVIIIDEVQALPGHLCTPIFDVLRQLCANYGATVVLSTATQPDFESIPGFASLKIREIVPNPKRFFEVLNRVEFELQREPISWAECAERMLDAQQCLTVVNTKRDAFALLDALDDPGALHLSTLLCGAHRSAVIREVRRRLSANEPCRLVSTQVIEAGVDLDFPMVMRAMAPLDSIIQAAGRCNREGRLPRKGKVIVFRPNSGGLPPGFYLTASGVADAVLACVSRPDFNDPELAKEYFKRLFATIETDRERIQELRRAFNYTAVSSRFRMIEDDMSSVVVPYGSEQVRRETKALVERLRAGAPDGRRLLRKLQPFLVPVRASAAKQYKSAGLIKEIGIGWGIGEWQGTYDPVRGLVADDSSLTELVAIA